MAVVAYRRSTSVTVIRPRMRQPFQKNLKTVPERPGAITTIPHLYVVTEPSPVHSKFKDVGQPGLT
jgi:hypothetical protein